MKRIKMGGWILLATLALGTTGAAAGEQQELRTQQEKISYGIGVGMGMNLKRQGLQVDPALVAKGMQDFLAGQTLLMSDADLRKTMTDLQTELTQKQLQARQLAMESNKRDEEAFLAENKTKPGVTTLASGLQYQILREGHGQKPTQNDSVECNYRGFLVNGQEFDSSYLTGKSAVFKVSDVIRGWTEALQLMPVGSQWRLFIPSRLAYGNQGAGALIGPNAMLIFDVDLIAIE